MTHVKIAGYLQDGGRLLTRKTIILSLIDVSKIKSKSSFTGFKKIFKSLFVVQSDIFIPTRHINSITSY